MTIKTFLLFSAMASALTSTVTAFLVKKPMSRMSMHQRSIRLYSRYRQSRAKAGSTASDALDWETFEFSERPKWVDAKKQRAVMESTQTMEEVAQLEAQEDQNMARHLKERREALDSLSPQMVRDATRILLPYINSNRMGRVDSVLNQRTQHVRFLFENPSNPSNVWACLRTIDSFGIQHVDLVVDSAKYKGRAALSQKSGMRTAMGSAQWLTIHNHVSTKEAVQELKESKGFKLYASDLNPNSKDIRDIDWGNDNDDSPICIVMGNEGIGISKEMRQLADETFTLPMYGFAESFNLSVATAITCAHLSACSKSGNGPLRRGDLKEHEYNCLRLKGILNSIQERTGRALLKRDGIVLPEAIEWL